MIEFKSLIVAVCIYAYNQLLENNNIINPAYEISFYYLLLASNTTAEI
jgi:hypothetical protein